MSKTAKVSLYIGVTLVLILVALYVLIKVVVTPEKVRETLLPLAEKSLQREVDIGEINIGIFSGVSITDLHVQEKETADDFIAIKRLALHYQLLPLLTGNIVIDQVLLESPRVKVVRFENGTFNFSDLTGTGEKQSAKQKEESGDGASSPLDLLINEVAINGGEIIFTDHAQGKTAQQHRFENVNLLLSKFTLDGAFPVELSAILNGSQVTIAGHYDIASQAGDLDVRLAALNLTDFSPYYKPSLSGKLGSAALTLDLELQFKPQLIESKGKVQLAGLDLLLDALPEAELTQADLIFDYSLSFDQSQQVLGLSTFLVDLNGVAVGAEGTIELAGKEPKLSLALLLDNFDLNALFEGLPSGLTKDYRQYALRGILNGRVSLAGTASDGPKLLKSADIRLDKVSAKVDALNPAISGTVAFSQQKLTAEKVTVDVADQRIHVDLAADNLFADIITGEFKVSADQLDLNRLLPAADGNEKQPVVKRKATVADEIGPFNIPVAMKGTMQVGKLLYKQLNLDQVQADLVLKDNLLKIEKLQSGVAGGKFVAKSEVNLGVKGLTYNGEMSLDQSNLLSLVTVFVPQAEQSVSGLLQWNNNFSGRGTIPDNLLKSLQLKGVMQLQNGKITGSPLLEQLAVFLGVPDLKILDFDLFEGRYDLRDGLTNLSGQLNSSKARLTPKGTVGVDGSLDMSLDTRIAPDLMKKLGVKTGLQNQLSDENGWGILPLVLKGSLTSPKIAFDAKALQKQATGKVKEEATKRLLDKIAPKDSGTQEPVKKLLEGTLDKLFSN